MICLICNKEYTQLGVHLKKFHKITPKEYYNTYFKKEHDGKCAVCGKPTKFISLTNGYALNCSKKCAANNDAIKEKRKKTNLQRYGVENVFESSMIKEKSKQTILDRYGDAQYRIKKAHKTQIEKYGSTGFGVKSIKEKIEKTCVEKYGVDNVRKSEEIRQKGKQTCLEKYGNENYNNSAKRRQTCLEKYGTEEILANKNIRTKIKQTNLKKYGTENVFASSIIKNKIKETCLKKYGSKYWLESDVRKKLYEKTQFAKYGDWHVRTDDFKLKAAKTKRKNGTHNTSKQEDFLYNQIASFYDGKIIRNDYSSIKSDLDIYLPDLNIAIEYNGNYWHSYPSTEKDYHLHKSLLCREHNIRLIHIYEFEDIDIQLEHLRQLILYNNDTYNLNDFNKNNLIDLIPSKPEIIFQNNRYCVYGAGKLF